MKRVGIALAWILLFFVVGFGLTIGLSKVLPGLGGPSWDLARNVAYELIGFTMATLLVGRLLNKQSWDRMGWRPGVGARLVRGGAIGALMAALAIGVAVLVDRATVGVTAEGAGPWLTAAARLAPVLLAAALAEELAFRGYALRRLADAIGPWSATLVLALPFGLLHLGNPHASTFSTANVVLAGVWLSWAFFSTGGMALAWGLHFGWNAGLALLFDAPVSGYAFQVPAVEYAAGLHAWVDGGSFGPEGGIVATLVVTAGILVFTSASWQRARQWVAA